jgi:fumarate hydratase class II
VEIALKAYREDITLREAAMWLDYLTPAEFDELVRPEEMTQATH